MATKNKATAARGETRSLHMSAEFKAIPAKISDKNDKHILSDSPFTIGVGGTETIGNILTQFGKVHIHGRREFSLRFTVESDSRMDTVPAPVTEADLMAVASDADKRVLEAAKAVKERLKGKAKEHARARVGSGEREVWTTRMKVKRG